MSDCYDTRERCIYCGYKANTFVEVNNLKACPQCNKIQPTYIIVKKRIDVKKSISNKNLSDYLRDGWEIVGWGTE